jgi:hypothetical protein
LPSDVILAPLLTCCFPQKSIHVGRDAQRVGMQRRLSGGDANDMLKADAVGSRQAEQHPYRWVGCPALFKFPHMRLRETGAFAGLLQGQVTLFAKMDATRRDLGYQLIVNIDPAAAHACGSTYQRTLPAFQCSRSQRRSSMIQPPAPKRANGCHPNMLT